jgi:hypothetical protein
MTDHEQRKIHSARQRLAEIIEELTAVTDRSTNYDMAMDVGYTVRMLLHSQHSLEEIAGAYAPEEA